MGAQDQEDAETPKGGATVVLTFRLQPEDVEDVKAAAIMQRTNVSSLVRGALVQVGLLKNHPKEGNTEQEVNHGL